MVELFARRLFDDGANDEIGLGHHIVSGDLRSSGPRLCLLCVLVG
jgi:hypothetical protein